MCFAFSLNGSGWPCRIWIWKHTGWTAVRQSGRLVYLGRRTPAWGKVNSLDINWKTRAKLRPCRIKQDVKIPQILQVNYLSLRNGLLEFLNSHLNPLLLWTCLDDAVNCRVNHRRLSEWCSLAWRVSDPEMPSAELPRAPGPWTWIEAGLATPAECFWNAHYDLLDVFP